jgi:Protein of unknown function (DUF992)
MKSLVPLTVLAAALAAPAAFAQDSGTQVGTLTCKMSGVENLVVYTKEEFDCEFAQNDAGSSSYKGVIHEVGVNLSVTKDAKLVWGVIAPSGEVSSPDALKGHYVGAGGQVELAGGVGANVLIGGNAKTINLEPLSVEGMEGFGAALDITDFELK